jgi:hypothetical protein
VLPGPSVTLETVLGAASIPAGGQATRSTVAQMARQSDAARSTRRNMQQLWPVAAFLVKRVAKRLKLDRV